MILDSRRLLSAPDAPGGKPARGATSARARAMTAKKPDNADSGLLLQVRLDFETLEVWRLLAVPAACTFTQLHRIIQASFAWQNEHLHQFQVLGEQQDVLAESKGPGLEEEQHFDRDVDLFSERRRILPLLMDHPVIWYIYDFGDYWNHRIEYRGLAADPVNPLPVCLDGAGDAPPEDVGGESGFVDFLRVVNNPRDTRQKEDMLAWAGSYWQPFDLAAINRRLLKL